MNRRALIIGGASLALAGGGAAASFASTGSTEDYAKKLIRHRTALSLFLVAFGILYANVNDLLFFHAAAVPEAALDDVKPLYFALMTLIGGSSSALGLLGGFVTLGPVRGGSTIAAAALATTYSVAFVMAAVTAEKLAAATGAPTSWHIMGVLLAITAVALGSHVLGKRAPGPARDGRM